MWTKSALRLSAVKYKQFLFSRTVQRLPQGDDKKFDVIDILRRFLREVFLIFGVVKPGPMEKQTLPIKRLAATGIGCLVFMYIWDINTREGQWK